MKLKIYFIIRKLIFCLLKGHNSKTAKGIIIKINFDLYLIAIIDHIFFYMINNSNQIKVKINFDVDAYYYYAP
jgi:hypothetical protein